MIITRKPFADFVIKFILFLIFALWVILPDPLPILVDDIIAFVLMIITGIDSIGDIQKSLRM